MSVASGFAPRSMPARLAIRPDFRILGWGQGPVGSQMRAPLRRWATSKTNEAVVGRPLACTWLTTTPERITPDDILSSLPIPTSDLALEYTPILLATPAFAHWVDIKSTFLEQCMDRFYHKTQKPVHAVVGIVDGLPDNHSRDQAGDSESEGMSVILAKLGNVRGKAVAPRQVRSIEKEEPTLLFSFRKDVGNYEPAYQSFHQVGLRLANTIFLNGKENTLFGTRWAHNPTLKKLNLEESVDLSTCSVTITPRKIHNSLELPLHPVGERRKVISSMGNIVRQIAKHADSRSNEPMPASSELEKELPRYIAEHNITDQRVSVWALIEKSAENPYDKSRHSPSSLAESIQMGAKLHRVMSGGGGWGKKQGLLSLDPEMSFQQADNEDLLTLHGIFSPNREESTHEVASPFEQRMFMEDLSTLSQAAEPGDYVQFFASIEGYQRQDSHNTASEYLEESLSCDFGVMSDADTILSPGIQQSDLTVIPNYFGALSEKAITYLQPVNEARSNDVSDTCTKIDVPGSRVALVLE
ncbi:hypothetical protein BDW59DRAFT_155803 [Aspergillus cavernicola]|uniref:Uncharacterized protein n=1 Tax=Aspergillus cavernicola TaxID=176166 RepID=A0ABR4J591_9EURO